MPTIFTHAIAPLALGAALGQRAIPPRLLLAGAAVAMLPDLDVIAFRLGIPYADAFGHRGAGHSLLFALLVALLGAAGPAFTGSTRIRTGLWLFASAASHPLLDALTNGGLGVALAWPWSDARFFAPWRPIAVSPIGTGFFSLRGWQVMLSELRWVWLPTFACAGALFALRKMRTQAPAKTG